MSSSWQQAAHSTIYCYHCYAVQVGNDEAVTAN